jgi:N-acetyl-gamma-glutamylphosphate reductase
MAEDSAAATDSAALVISMAVDSAAGISSTVAVEVSSTVAVEASSTVAVEASSTVEVDPMVVVPTAAVRAEADIADRASTFRLCTNGWRLASRFFSPISDLQKGASTQSVQKANQCRFC